MKAPASKALVRGAKIVLAVVLLAWLLRQVHWQDYPVVNEEGRTIVHAGLASTLGQVNVTLLACAVLMLGLCHVLTALRWRMLLGIAGVRIGVGQIVRLTFLGEFFSAVMPGMLGGDVVKAYCVARQSTRRVGVLFSVVVDRLMGAGGLAVLAALMLAVNWRGRHVGNPAMLWAGISTAAILLGLAVASAILFSGRVRGFIGLRRLYRWLPGGRRLTEVQAAAGQYRGCGRTLLRAVGITILSQLVGLVSVMLVGWSLNLHVPWQNYLLYMPLVTIIAAVPVTPGSVGIFENLCVFFLAGADSVSELLGFALLVRLSEVVCSLPGAVVLAGGPRLPRAAQIEAELNQSVPSPAPKGPPVTLLSSRA